MLPVLICHWMTFIDISLGINKYLAAEIWDTLRAVTSDPDNPNNTLILESAGVTVHDNDLRTTYDERGTVLL